MPSHQRLTESEKQARIKARAEERARRKAWEDYDKQCRKKNLAEKKQKREADLELRRKERDAAREHRETLNRLKLKHHYERVQESLEKKQEDSTDRLERSRVFNGTAAVEVAPGKLKIHLRTTPPEKTSRHVKLDTTDGKLVLRLTLPKTKAPGSGSSSTPVSDPDKPEGPTEMTGVTLPEPPQKSLLQFTRRPLPKPSFLDRLEQQEEMEGMQASQE